MNNLIVYFSHRGETYNVGYLEEGNAEHIAKTIQNYVRGEIFELVPKHPYSEDYMKCINEAKEELEKDARSEYVGDIDVSKYDTIYLCYPNWWGTYPRIVATFLEKHDFTGKIIYPMCTHEGSGMGRSEAELRKALPNSIINKGLAIKGTDARNSDQKIYAWVKS